MSSKTVTLATALIAGTAALLATRGADAAGYPEHPIHVSACYAAGGGVDRNLRIVERVATKHLPAALLPQYKTGASGTLAMQYIKAADPAGYELAICDNGGSVIAPIAQGLDFGPKDVRALAQISFVPWILTVRAESPYKTVEDLIKAAKDSSTPIDVEVSDLASSDHYSWLLFIKAAGLSPSDFRWKPHGGGGPKMRAILAGEGDLLLEDAGEIAGHAKAGTLRPLAVMSEKRAPEFPDVPTLRELNIDVIGGSSMVLFAPPSISDENVAVLRKALTDVKADPLLTESFLKTAQDPATFIVGQDFEDGWRKEWETASTLLREALGR
jgi:tripartite-type tricarboxylate transporter receptor subunit TctC